MEDEIATGEVVEYSWDHRNRLVQVVKKDAQGAVIETVDIEYDLFDRKIEKTVTPQVGPASLSQYVYDGDHLALRFENGNRFIAIVDNGHAAVVDGIRKVNGVRYVVVSICRSSGSGGRFVS